MVIRILASLLLVGVFASAQERRPTPDEQLQAGLHREQTLGDCKGAIDEYKAVAARRDISRTISAQALAGMARCYEKLGQQTAAHAIYEQIARDYPDQKESAAAARARVQQENSAVVRTVWKGDRADASGGASPNGRYLAFTDWETGDLAVRDLRAGTSRRLTTQAAPYADGYAADARFSRDGRHVVFGWATTSSFDLRTIGMDGSNLRVIYANPEVEYIKSADWSPDGRRILVKTQTRSRTAQIAFIPVTDHSAVVLKTLAWGTLGNVSLSPDGRYVAFDHQLEEQSAGRRVSVMSSDGSQTNIMTDTAARDEVFGWSPDGTRLLFASDRTGRRELWSVHVRDGRVKGSPELLRTDIGRNMPLGITQDGSLFLATNTTTSDVFIASMDLATGSLLAAPKIVGRRVLGVNRDPAWSLDGQRLAYLSGIGSPTQPTITIVSTDDATEQQLVAKLSRAYSGVSWSPDGASLLVIGFDEKNRRGIFSIGVDTGDVSPLVYDPPGRDLFEAEWLSQSEILYYRRINDEPVPGEIVVRNVRSGVERLLPHGLDIVRYLFTAASPDRQSVAVCVNGDDVSVLRVVPVDGGAAREVLRRDKGVRVRVLGWTADSAHVIAATYRQAGPRDVDYVVWRIPAAGGAAEKLPTLEVRARRWRVHPDGRRVAFDARSGGVEIAVVEHFLPAKTPTESR